MAPTYLMLNLSKLDKKIILEWTQIHLIENKKRLLKFCQYLPINFIEQYSKIDTYENLVIPVIFQKLRIVRILLSSLLVYIQTQTHELHKQLT